MYNSSPFAKHILPNEGNTMFIPEPFVKEPPKSSMIIGSFSKPKILELIDANKIPDCYAHSVGIFEIETGRMLSVNRGYGDVDCDKLYDGGFAYYTIIWRQPTNVGRNLQPATMMADRHSYYELNLWHIGNLTPNAVKRLQHDEDNIERWDTQLFIKHLCRFGAPVDIEGSFACVYCDDIDLFVFRNELENMYIDNDMNICSNVFPDSFVVSQNKVWKFDWKKKQINSVEEFQTVKQWWKI